MGTKYSHLTEADRVLIEAMHRAGQSGRSIAAAVGVHPSTISREISRSRTVPTPHNEGFAASSARLEWPDASSALTCVHRDGELFLTVFVVVGRLSRSQAT